MALTLQENQPLLFTQSKTLYSLEDFDDDYDFGINKENLSINFIETSTGTVKLENGEMLNPFFVSINGGSLSLIESKEIYSGYKRVFFMCMKNDFVFTKDLFQITDQIVKTNQFYTIGKQFTLVEASLSPLRNIIYKNRACLVEKQHLTKMFSHMDTLVQSFDINEIIIPIIEQTQSNVNTIVELYDKKYSVTNIKHILDIANFYNKTYKKPIVDQLTNMLGSLKESQFWSDSNNCNINMTENFMSRKFNYKDNTDGSENMMFNENGIKQKETEIENVINTLITTDSKDKKKDVDYIANINGNHQFVDIGSCLKSSTNRTYYITDESKLQINKKDVEELICSLDNELELYNLFNSLVVSKDYCHMVLNNEKILNKMSGLFEKYAPVYKYLLGYAWQCFTIEESIMKTKTTKQSRYVFNINTANKLPVFPFVMEDLTQNPYFSLLVNQKILNPMANAVSLHCLRQPERYYGVCNFEQFKWRFNLFVSGDPNLDLFNGIDWNYFGMSGSLVTACIQKKSPLFEIISSPNDSEITKWNTFFNNYYSESDIDMMCNEDSIFGFTKKTEDVIEQIKKNMPNYTNGDITIEPIKSVLLLVTDHFYTERLQHFNEFFNDKYESKDMKNKFNSDEMKEFLYGFYHEHKSKFNSQIRKAKRNTDDYIKSFMTIVAPNEMKLKQIKTSVTKQYDTKHDSDISFYINDFRGPNEKVPESENYLVIKICENIKFKIRSPKMKTVELFRSKTKDFFGMVAKFHLPCVRSYYQGNDVYILPTCTTAMMTGINIDYKYFAGVRDPIEILNKNRMRCFGSLLSDNEKKHMAYYNNNVKESFGGLFHVAGNDKNEINKMFGPRVLTDKIFKPLVYTQNLPPSTYHNPNVMYITTLDELKQYYKYKYGYDENIFGFNLFTIKTINDNGSLNPLKTWVANEYYNFLSTIQTSTNTNSSDLTNFNTPSNNNVLTNNMLINDVSTNNYKSLHKPTRTTGNSLHRYDFSLDPSQYAPTGTGPIISIKGINMNDKENETKKEKKSKYVTKEKHSYISPNKQK